MLKLITAGNCVFLVGAILETWALTKGVHTPIVAWSLIVYGVVLLWKGYQ